jgi:hypothetical protein
LGETAGFGDTAGCVVVAGWGAGSGWGAGAGCGETAGWVVALVLVEAAAFFVVVPAPVVDAA